MPHLAGKRWSNRIRGDLLTIWKYIQAIVLMTRFRIGYNKHGAWQEMKMVGDALRRLYNKVDIQFDRQAITRQLRFSREIGGTGRPVTARVAFQSVQPIARQLDRQARLKSIVSQQGLNQDGASAHWEFFFDLSQRRTKLVCEWVLTWDEVRDAYGPATNENIAIPFPPPDSPLHQMVKEGKLLHRQLIGLWKQECRRTSYLPNKFRNTDEVSAEFSRQGLDLVKVEFSLSTGLSPEGHLSWIANSRRQQFFVAFGI
jgi:hypothetical protein